MPRLNTSATHGRIVELHRTKGYGFFAQSGTGRRIYFHFSDKLEPEDILSEGDFVTACLVEDQQKRCRGLQVRRLRTPL